MSLMNTLLELMNAPIFWFLVGFVLLIAELAMPTLIIFFFGFGAWITSAASALGLEEAYPQLLLFLSSSMLCLLLFRRALRERLHRIPEDEEELRDPSIGKLVVTLTKLGPDRLGKVELNGSGWQALAREEIAEGALVQIIAKENLTLTVAPAEKSAPEAG